MQERSHLARATLTTESATLTLRRAGSSLALLLLGLGALTGACSSNPAESGEPAATFATELRETTNSLTSGQAVALTDTTDFDWDNVHFFAAGTKRSIINERIGIALFDIDLDEREGNFREDFIAVFTRDGRVVHQTTVPSYFEIPHNKLASGSAIVRRTNAVGGGERFSISSDPS